MQLLDFGILSIAFKVIKNRMNKNDMFCDVKVFYKDKSLNIKAMIDTGNMLKDPISKTPVIIIQKDKLQSIIDRHILDNLEQIIYGNYIEEIEQDYISRFRLIPFSSLGKQNGMLIGFKPDEVKIEFDGIETKQKNTIIRNIRERNI